MATACPGDLAGLRDRALLLLAAAGLGRSALVGLDVEQVHFTEAGADLVLHSRLGAELTTLTVRRVASLGACPVRALKNWLDATDSRFGPVFRKVDRWGNVEYRRLGTDAIRRVLARRARRRVRHGATP
jgi:site-specific recombinase XerC